MPRERLEGCEGPKKQISAKDLTSLAAVAPEQHRRVSCPSSKPPLLSSPVAISLFLRLVSTHCLAAAAPPSRPLSKLSVPNGQEGSPGSHRRRRCLERSCWSIQAFRIRCPCQKAPRRRLWERSFRPPGPACPDRPCGNGALTLPSIRQIRPLQQSRQASLDQENHLRHKECTLSDQPLYWTSEWGPRAWASCRNQAQVSLGPERLRKIGAPEDGARHVPSEPHTSPRFFVHAGTLGMLWRISSNWSTAPGTREYHRL